MTSSRIFDHVEVHQRADRVLRVGHRSAQLLALLGGQRLEDVVYDLPRQVGREVGDLVGVELLGGGDQLALVHVRDQRLAHGIGDLEQDLAVALGLDQVPDSQTLVERQRLEDVGDIGRMQAVEQLLQRRQVLAVHQRLDQFLARTLLALHEVLHQLVAMQQLDDLLEMRLYSGTGFLPVGHARFQGRIGQLNLRPHSR